MSEGHSRCDEVHMARVLNKKRNAFYIYTAQLICAFVFAYAIIWFARDAAHLFLSLFCPDSD